MDNLEDMASPAFNLTAYTPGFSDHGTPAGYHSTSNGVSPDENQTTLGSLSPLDGILSLERSSSIDATHRGENMSGGTTPTGKCLLSRNAFDTPHHSLDTDPSELLRKQANIKSLVSIHPGADDNILLGADYILLEITQQIRRIADFIHLHRVRSNLKPPEDPFTVLENHLKDTGLTQYYILRNAISLGENSPSNGPMVAGLKAFSLYVRFLSECCSTVLSESPFSEQFEGNLTALFFMAENIRIGVARTISEAHFRNISTYVPNLTSDRLWGCKSKQGHKFCTFAITYQTLWRDLPESPWICPTCPWKDAGAGFRIQRHNLISSSENAGRVFLKHAFLLKSHLQQDEREKTPPLYGCTLCHEEKINTFDDTVALATHLLSKHTTQTLRSCPDIVWEDSYKSYDAFGGRIPYR